MGCSSSFPKVGVTSATQMHSIFGLELLLVLCSTERQACAADCSLAEQLSTRSFAMKQLPKAYVDSQILP